MKEATVIYPNQLFLEHPGLALERTVYLVEEPLFLTEFPVHTQKLLLHRLSMRAYKIYLEEQGYQVIYLDISSLSDSTSIFSALANASITHLHICDTTDRWLERRIEKSVRVHSFTLTHYESPLFILSKEEAVARYQKSGKHMARFYKRLRIDKKILTTDTNEPKGGAWSFDEDNRKKLPNNVSLPSDITTVESADVNDALRWLESVPGERYGDAAVWVPWTHATAEAHLHNFVTERLHHFGDYEDALTINHSQLFHSTLSPLINIGLLTPTQVLATVITYGNEHDIPLNNIEGFVRQVLGWREFIRASYECDGTTMRTKNFWQHTRTLPPSFWSGTTGVLPVDITINRALQHGYNHHIERLMVLGNFMLLSHTHPDEAYRWFMAMYVDAYDWVMVPNVYGMSQFADGGIFATKPYISGSSYLKKMSDFPGGDWEELWTALYWNFIDTHKAFFNKNHRLSMMPKLLEKMSTAKRSAFEKRASAYFSSSE
ncbi:cryptochrome/photolyase family protein [Patescibacteria group bacterium]|nr:cryptochrome/photolyase family protein [Patescibacteria group bacterium]